jgi:hypothetical protein
MLLPTPNTRSVRRMVGAHGNVLASLAGNVLASLAGNVLASGQSASRRVLECIEMPTRCHVVSAECIQVLTSHISRTTHLYL